jgi:hypothetical protein
VEIGLLGLLPSRRCANWRLANWLVVTMLQAKKEMDMR